jgi:biotin operon repressor
MKGWIKLHRKLMDWEWYQYPHMLHLFVHLLLRANHKGKSWQGKLIKRGQLITSRDKLSEETSISANMIYERLKKLEESGEIAQQPSNKYTLITICNFDLYQDETKEQILKNVQQYNNKTTSRQHQNDTNKNVEKRIEGEEDKEYSVELFNFYNEIILFFPENTRPKKVAQKKGWLDTIEKLHSEGYSLSEIKRIVKHFREDNFWSSNFMSLTKLIKRNQDGVRYVDVFIEKLKKEKPDFRVEKEKMAEMQKNPNRMRIK